MLKKFYLIAAFLIVFLSSAGRLNAASEFAVDANVNYIFQQNGIANITHDITLENLYSNLYATSYTLTLENVKTQNLAAFEDNKELLVEKSVGEGKTDYKILFDQGVVGKGSKRNFKITFDVEDVSSKTGTVWEIAIPKLGNSDSFREYKASISVPVSFGELSYISPKYLSVNKLDDNVIYSFNKEALANFGISAGFGDFQVFSYTLNYHLENPLSRYQQQSIPVPPDTSFQKVFLENVSPAPKKLQEDSNGNWLAFYDLKPREKLDIVVVGTVQIFAEPRFGNPLSDEEISLYTSATNYWQATDPVVELVAKDLSDAKSIYNYLVTTFKYDYERVKPNMKRLGAIQALLNPTNAICTEFTDTFIALARSKGIPAREINGFAYTENPDIQPLGLVADVLHAWPEYYSFDKNAWIPVDPTWGNTTGGVDFFDKLDLRHFTFVIHATDSENPPPPGSYKLGPNPQKDVFVSFGKLPDNKTPSIKLTAKKKANLAINNSIIEVLIQNTGMVGVYNIVPKVYFDDLKIDLDPITKLLPFSQTSVDVRVPITFLGLNTPDKVKIVVLGEEFTIYGFKTKVLLDSFLAFLILLIIITCTVLIYLNRENLLKIGKARHAPIIDQKKNSINKK